MGRTSDFDENIAQRILERIVSSSDSISRICQEDGMPPKATVYSWLALNPVFADQYARMKQIQCLIYADETVDIAEFATPEDFQVARLRIDTRKWHLSKLLPKVYGDKIQQEVSGKDGAPFTVVVSSVLDRDK